MRLAFSLLVFWVLSGYGFVENLRAYWVRGGVPVPLNPLRRSRPTTISLSVNLHRDLEQIAEEKLSTVSQVSRELIREVLEGPLHFEPEGQTYRFRGVVATGSLIVGAVRPEFVASPTAKSAVGPVVGGLLRAA